MKVLVAPGGLVVQDANKKTGSSPVFLQSNLALFILGKPSSLP